MAPDAGAYRKIKSQSSMDANITPKQVFEANQVLTLEIAKTLIGKKIAFTHPVYKANQLTVKIISVGDVIPEWELASKEDYSMSDSRFKTRQDYWKSYMSEKRIDECKTTLVLVTNEGMDSYCRCHTKYDNCYSTPTFTCSDADREVYYVVINDEDHVA